MADLRFTDEMLQRIQATMADMERVLERPARAMRTTLDHDLGHTRLTPAVEDFADAWQYGIDQLGRCSAEAVESLQDIRSAFAAADADLADELNHDKHGPPKSVATPRSARPPLQPNHPLPTGPPWPTMPTPDVWSGNDRSTGGRSTGP